jgi:hypothetical protein
MLLLLLLLLVVVAFVPFKCMTERESESCSKMSSIAVGIVNGWSGGCC